ncbi:MAG TPA: glycosyltransferase [Candidatus Limnocylindrales bacterium]|nr:glycosyltransferase [Candidatus Limnocylindrales bacterium]
MISVIATVLNEGESIRGLLNSLAGQTLPPDEVVIVDGGSRDQTLAILREYSGRLPLHVIEVPGCSISAGRNRAIAEAHGDLIASTDAGVVLVPGWLESLMAPLRSDSAVSVVGGFFEADARTVFEAALGAATLPLVEEIDAATFLPSSRSVAFRRAAWEAVGGYPEWLDYCEDLIFDLRLKVAAPNWVFAPAAVVHFRPRKSLRAFMRQYTLYARGDGKADLWRKRHAIRYVTYFLALPVLLALLIFGRPSLQFIGAGLAVLGASAYLATPYRRLPSVLRAAAERGAVPLTRAAWIQAILWIPVIRAAGDIAKMVGYPAGWLWRIRNKPADWRALPLP